MQCTSPCCAGQPLALQPTGCLFTGSEFERHAGKPSMRSMHRGSCRGRARKPAGSTAVKWRACSCGELALPDPRLLYNGFTVTCPALPARVREAQEVEREHPGAGA